MASGTNGGFLHTVFGLRIRSALALPELARLPDGGTAADVVIERGGIADRLDDAVEVDPAMQVAAAHFQLDLPAGRFRVSEGRRIVVDPRPGTADADLRPYLLGTVMGALCHQRALLPLHAAAVLTGEEVVAFAGPSGAGKSTLAAHFHRRGGGVLADDLLAVEVGPDGGPRVRPGLARIRLRRDAAGESVAKISMPIALPGAPGAWPLRRLYLLRAEGEDPPRISRLRGPEAVAAAVSQVYRWPIAAAMGQAPASFARCLALARRCEVFEVSFAHAAADPLAMAGALEAHLTSR
jgi:hypothetical protein